MKFPSKCFAVSMMAMIGPLSTVVSAEHLTKGGGAKKKNKAFPRGVEEQHRQLFFRWMQQHGKDYPDSGELLGRMNVWLDNHGMLL